MERSLFAEVGQRLGVESIQIARFCDLTANHYHHWNLPKKRGGTRPISAPRPELAEIQRRIAARLNHVRIHPAATAFFVGASVAENARRHMNRSFVMHFDLRNFFPSIRFNRVKDLFSDLGEPEGISTILAILTTESSDFSSSGITSTELSERVLPQGAPSSPTIANLVCRELDKRLCDFASAHGFTYSRYCDDIVFSTNGSRKLIGLLMNRTRRIVRECGFEINESKTSIKRRSNRQVVTGLVVNDGLPRVSRRDIRSFRAFLHQLRNHGTDLTWERLNRDAPTTKREREPCTYASGYLAYVFSVNKEQARTILRQHPWLPDVCEGVLGNDK